MNHYHAQIRSYRNHVLNGRGCRHDRFQEVVEHERSWHSQMRSPIQKHSSSLPSTIQKSVSNGRGPERSINLDMDRLWYKRLRRKSQ